MRVKNFTSRPIATNNKEATRLETIRWLCFQLGARRTDILLVAVARRVQRHLVPRLVCCCDRVSILLLQQVHSFDVELKLSLAVQGVGVPCMIFCGEKTCDDAESVAAPLPLRSCLLGLLVAFTRPRTACVAPCAPRRCHPAANGGSVVVGSLWRLRGETLGNLVLSRRRFGDCFSVTVEIDFPAVHVGHKDRAIRARQLHQGREKRNLRPVPADYLPLLRLRPKRHSRHVQHSNFVGFPLLLDVQGREGGDLSSI
mmetsp:Transcript_24407/g.79718  ORF Transcript_24407/g.79718 Transcript_24407/m.79718 type:complete len:256 (-) Transcript_24407:871-1638(-)